MDNPPVIRIHQVYDEISERITEVGFIRNALRTLSPNDLSHLRSILPPIVHTAAARGSPGTLLLLRHEFGFTWYHQYSDAGTALHAAAASGNLSNLELLVSYCRDEYDVDAATSKTTKTPLQIACRHGQLEAVRMLLDAGADVNKADTRGDTALHGACHSGVVAIARELCSRNACVDVINFAGQAPWSIACDTCNLALIRVVYHKDAKTYLQPAQHAVSSSVLSDLQSLEVVKVLHQLGESFDVVTSVGLDLYHIALKKEKVMVADFVRTITTPKSVVPVPYM
jgi:hypothetical protein